MDEEQMIYDEPMEPGSEETIDFDWDTAVRGQHFIPREKGNVTLDEDVYGIFPASSRRGQQRASHPHQRRTHSAFSK